MVARINTGKNIARVLNYNEHKVQQGRAEILYASGFIKNMERLTFNDKINHFERHTSLNERAKTNSLHVSLNFDVSEKLNNDTLIAIANTYMDKIGFAAQPYLVYHHHDAGHPHIHIVSTNIKSNGDRISMHRMGANQSEKARKEIEIEFNLVKAQKENGISGEKILPVNAAKIIYGKSETKRAIANVLMMVLNQYKYGSLPELNAVLQLYNVVADRGEADSRLYKLKGLFYRALDEKGNKVGTPVKASDFYMKPTLKMLEQKFIANELLKEPFKSKLQTSVTWILKNPPKNMGLFIKALAKENISVILRKGKQDNVYGITYVDHRTKTVFNGSDLGKEYSAKAVLEKCAAENMLQPSLVLPKRTKQREPQSAKSKQKQDTILKKPGVNSNENIAADKMPYEPIPFPFRIKKKRKKKRKNR
jgi:hypothetical protein